MEKIREFIKSCQTLHWSKKSYHWHTNVYENVQHALRGIEIVEKNVEMVEQALIEYLEKNQNKTTFIKEWLLYGIQLLSTEFVPYSHGVEFPPDVKEVWPLFFDDTIFEGYDISYPKTKDLMKMIREKSSISLCDDADILAIHKDKKCNCMYMCSYCEEMEVAWHKKVRSMYATPKNIFLHKNIQSEFVEKWCSSNRDYPFKWPPTKVYYQGSLMSSYKNVCITDYADMCAYVKETRKKYKEGGKTPLQCCDELCHDILSTFHYISANDSDLTIFMKLWSKIDMIPLWIAYDKARCKEILKML
jgi:hypothetical protein